MSRPETVLVEVPVKEIVGAVIEQLVEGGTLVEVVRCKDCKYHDGECVGMVYCPNKVGGWVSEEFYCADGERRDDERRT